MSRDEELYRRISQLEKWQEGFKYPELPLGLSLIDLQAGSGTSIAFSSIPQGFRHLMLIGAVRSSASAENDGLILQFNGDTGSNYDWQRMTANNTTLSGSVGRGVTSIQIGAIEAANSRAASFSPVHAYIYLYANGTTYEKYTLSQNTMFGDVSADADMFVQLRGGRWRSTAAITSITLSPTTGPNFVANSGFQLYGIR